MSLPSRSAVVQNKVRSRSSRRIVPIRHSTNGCDRGTLGNGLNLGHIEHSKVCLPLMESVQRIMIRTEIFGQGSAVDRSAKHPTQRRTVNDSTMNAEPDDSPRKLVHHDQNPMRSQACRFAAKQIATLEAVF